jgi:hypothetical protein
LTTSLGTVLQALGRFSRELDKPLAAGRKTTFATRSGAGSQAKEAEYSSTPIADRTCGPPINELASSTEKQENQDSL